MDYSKVTDYHEAERAARAAQAAATEPEHMGEFDRWRNPGKDGSWVAGKFVSQGRKSNVQVYSIPPRTGEESLPRFVVSLVDANGKYFPVTLFADVASGGKVRAVYRRFPLVRCYRPIDSRDPLGSDTWHSIDALNQAGATPNDGLNAIPGALHNADERRARFLVRERPHLTMNPFFGSVFAVSAPDEMHARKRFMEIASITDVDSEKRFKVTPIAPEREREIGFPVVECDAKGRPIEPRPASDEKPRKKVSA